MALMILPSEEVITECADTGGNSWNRYELLESVTETKTTRYNLALMLRACGPAQKSVHIAYCLSLMKTRFMLRTLPHTTVPSRAVQAESSRTFPLIE